MIQASRELHHLDLVGIFPWIPSGLVLEINAGNSALGKSLRAYGFDVTVLSWETMDIRHFRLQRQSYSAIFCLQVLPYIPNGERSRLIGRLKAALRPGGILVLGGITLADPSASEHRAQTSNRLNFRPTGVLAPSELKERLGDWVIRYFYEGLNQQSNGYISQIIAIKPSVPQSCKTKGLSRLGLGTGYACSQLSWPRQLTPRFLEFDLQDFASLDDDIRLLYLSRKTQLLPRDHGPSLLFYQSPALADYFSLVERIQARCQPPFWISVLPPAESLACHPDPAAYFRALKKWLKQLRKYLDCPLVLSYQPFENPELVRLFLNFLETCSFALEVEPLRMVQWLQEPGHNFERFQAQYPVQRIFHLRLTGMLRSHTLPDQNLWHQGLQLAQSLSQARKIQSLSLAFYPGGEMEPYWTDLQELMQSWGWFKP